nr:DMT family transporter [Nonomuraea coxensis]
MKDDDSATVGDGVAVPSGPSAAWGASGGLGVEASATSPVSAGSPVSGSPVSGSPVSAGSAGGVPSDASAASAGAVSGGSRVPSWATWRSGLWGSGVRGASARGARTPASDARRPDAQGPAARELAGQDLDARNPAARDLAVRRARTGGTFLAFLGVLAFSGSFPGTVFAMEGFNPWLVAIGRAAVAGLLAVVCLRAARRPLLPPRHLWGPYALISLGVVFGFPVFSGLALALGSSTSHAAVITALLPAATAACAVVRAGERPRPLFWAACLAGAAAVTAFTLLQQGRTAAATWPDLLLLAALGSAAIGYTEGGRLARDTPGWQVISHALVLSLPVTAPVTAALTVLTPVTVTPGALAGFAYVAVVSMFLGFFPWYAGLAKGGIARAGQTQLTQPLLTLLWAWFLMGERFGPVTVAAALAVLVCVAITQRART